MTEISDENKYWVRWGQRIRILRLLFAQVADLKQLMGSFLKTLGKTNPCLSYKTVN